MKPTPLDQDLRLGLVVFTMFAAALAALALAPTRPVADKHEPLLQSIPANFADWRVVNDGPEQVSLFAVDENGQNPMEKVYDDSLLRTYVDSLGHRMMVAIAYDRIQREEDRVHRPEICYIAQGFSIIKDDPFSFRFAGAFPIIQGREMLTRNGSRIEAVSYWIRIGDSFTQNPWVSRSYVITEGLAGRLHDGVLVRTSEIIPSPGDARNSFARQQIFLKAFLAAVDRPTGVLLAREGSGQEPL